MISLIDRRSAVNWLTNNGHQFYANQVDDISHSIIPVGGTETDDYILVRALYQTCPRDIVRKLECEVAQITTDIDTIK
jgi:hypothetical protein